MAQGVLIVKNKYLLGYPIEGSLNSHQPQPSFVYRDHLIKLHFPPHEEHQGEIIGFIEISAATHKEAHNIANEVISEFIDALSFVMKSSLFLSPPSVILRDEEGGSRRVAYRQISEDRISGLYITEKTKKTVEKFLNVLEKEELPNLSLRWLRFGYRARTFPEQFIYYWLALERAVGETQIRKKCPKCGTSLPSYPSIEKIKLRQLCHKYNEEVDDGYFEKIWKCRQKVFHGSRINAAFLHELLEVTPKIGRIVETFLSEKYQPEHKITVKFPVPKTKRHSVNGFYTFQTKNAQEHYAMDYPTDEQLRRFHEGSEVISEDGFDLETFEDYENW